MEHVDFFFNQSCDSQIFIFEDGSEFFACRLEWKWSHDKSIRNYHCVCIDAWVRVLVTLYLMAVTLFFLPPLLSGPLSEAAPTVTPSEAIPSKGNFVIMIRSYFEGIQLTFISLLQLNVPKSTI